MSRVVLIVLAAVILIIILCRKFISNVLKVVLPPVALGFIGGCGYYIYDSVGLKGLSPILIFFEAQDFVRYGLQDPIHNYGLIGGILIGLIIVFRKK